MILEYPVQTPRTASEIPTQRSCREIEKRAFGLQPKFHAAVAAVPSLVPLPETPTRVRQVAGYASRRQECENCTIDKKRKKTSSNAFSLWDTYPGYTCTPGHVGIPTPGSPGKVQHHSLPVAAGHVPPRHDNPGTNPGVLKIRVLGDVF
eukprot:1660859-Rhodomonas_salina.1